MLFFCLEAKNAKQAENEQKIRILLSFRQAQQESRVNCNLFNLFLMFENHKSREALI